MVSAFLGPEASQNGVRLFDISVTSQTTDRGGGIDAHLREKAFGAVAASGLTADYRMLNHLALSRDLGPNHFDNRDRAWHTVRLVDRPQSLGLDVQITPSAA